MVAAGRADQERPAPRRATLDPGGRAAEGRPAARRPGAAVRRSRGAVLRLVAGQAAARPSSCASACRGSARAAAEDARSSPERGDALPQWALHDLRRTVVTGMNELGIAPHVVEAVVNHVSGRAKAGVAGVYNRATYADREADGAAGLGRSSRPDARARRAQGDPDAGVMPALVTRLRRCSVWEPFGRVAMGAARKSRAEAGIMSTRHAAPFRLHSDRRGDSACTIRTHFLSRPTHPEEWAQAGGTSQVEIILGAYAITVRMD